MGFFDLFDFLVAKLLMPIGSALICIFLGWVVDEKVLRAEITNEGALKQPLYPVFRFIIRYFAPLCIILIFMNELGLFKILSGLLN
jgi:NSS family neurotransmitter:Na+ symporter